MTCPTLPVALALSFRWSHHSQNNEASYHKICRHADDHSSEHSQPHSSWIFCLLLLTLSGLLSVEAAEDKNAPDPAAAPDVQRYRSGMRNSIEGHQLNAKEIKAVLEALEHKTGFIGLRFDEAGFLRLEDKLSFSGGSAAARELLMAAMEGKKSVNLQSHNRSLNVAFARLGVPVLYTSHRTGAKIEVQPIEIDFSDFNFLRGSKEALAAFDLGFVLMHELAHAVLHLSDPVPGENGAGDCERFINRIRRDLGLPERQHYAAVTRQAMDSASRAMQTVAELTFAQKRNAESQTSDKTKWFYLNWEAKRVGLIAEPRRGIESGRAGATTVSAP